MAKYIPKVNDVVFMAGRGTLRLMVISVNTRKKTASLQVVPSSPSPVAFQEHNIDWARLIPLDTSQNALRIVREATEGK